MKAIVYKKYGGPEVLQLTDIEKPVPKDNEVLVRIVATTATAADARMRKGDPFIGRLYTGIQKPKRAVPGYEFSGEIEAIGRVVTQFKIGDQVLGGTTALGCYAAYMCMPENGLIVLKPEHMSFEEAAAIPSGAVTAMNFLKKGKVKPNQNVLLYGASGSVGTYAVQLAKALGANVTAVCSGKNVDLLKSLGADHVVDYTTTDFKKDVNKYDLIFDAVGKTTYSACKKALKHQGIFLSVDLNFSLLGTILWTSIIGKRKAGFSATGALSVTARLDLLREIIAIYEKGQLKSVIDRSYPLEQIVEAQHYVDQGHKKGNVIITV